MDGRRINSFIDKKSHHHPLVNKQTRPPATVAKAFNLINQPPRAINGKLLSQAVLPREQEQVETTD